MQPGQNLKELRARLGISLREVEEQSQKIAEAQGNPECLPGDTRKVRAPNGKSVLSGMIGIHLEVGEQERFAAGLLTSTLRLQRDKDSVNLRERLGIVKLQHPSFLRNIVLVKHSEIDCLLLVGPAHAPRLDGAYVLPAGFFVD